MEWAVPMGTPFTLELTKHKKLYFPERQIRIKSTHHLFTTTQVLKFSIKDFFSKYDHILVTFTEKKP